MTGSVENDGYLAMMSLKDNPRIIGLLLGQFEVIGLCTGTQSSMWNAVRTTAAL